MRTYPGHLTQVCKNRSNISKPRMRAGETQQMDTHRYRGHLKCM